MNLIEKYKFRIDQLNNGYPEVYKGEKIQLMRIVIKLLEAE